jgi:phenylacetate-CoA ligase
MNIKNKILEKLLLPIADLLIGSSFISKLRELRRECLLTEDELILLQKEKLQKLLRYSINNKKYYSSLKVQLNEKELDIKKFPIVDKQILFDKQDSLLSQPKNKLIKNASSGSTGQQSIVYWSKEEQSINRATQILWWEWSGYRFGDPILQTGITPNRGFVKYIKDKLLNTYYLQAFTHSKEDVLKALRWAQQQEAPILAGYASSLYVIAKYAIEENIKVEFKAAVSWGDKLFDHYKKTIYTAFGVNVCETYGSAEGLMMGGQKDLDNMYLMSSNVFIEIVDDKGNDVKDGELGHVLVTNLNGYAMPLIRYRIGDLAIKMPQNEYPINREYGFPIWKKIIGRDTDLVITESGKYLVVHSFTGVFEHIPEIKQFCVIQNSKKGIIIQFIKGQNFSKNILEKAKNIILGYVNEPFDIVFIEVNFIPPTKSGKPQLIISNLNK